MTIKRLTYFSGILLTIAAVILIISLSDLSESEEIIQDAQNNSDILLLLADELRESSRGLTSAIEKYVVTGNERYADEYMEIVMVRSGEKSRPDNREIAPGQLVSLDELMRQADYSEEELSLLRQSAVLSDRLTALEFEAMNAVRGLFPDSDGQYTINGEPNVNRAMELIFSHDYELEVIGIMTPLTLFRQQLDQRLDNTITIANDRHSRAIHMVRAIFIALMGLFIIFLLLVALVIVRPILKCDMFARQVAGGNFDIRLNYTSGNEIGSLAESLRLMLKSLLERIGLEEYMRYYSAVISSVDAGVITKDKNGLITDWNAGAECILGYKSEEIIGHSTKYYAPEDGHTAIDEIETRLKKGEHTSHVEVIRKHKDGRLIDCSASYTPIFDDKGIFDGSLAIFHDITQKKSDEQKAHKFAAIIAIADAGIIVKDRRGIVLEWNIGAENILGYAPDEIIGHSTKYYAPEEGHADIDKIEERLAKGEHIAHVEVIRKHKDGRLIDCSASYTPIYDDNGDFSGSVSIFHDVTVEKNAVKKAKHMAAIVSAADAGIVIKDTDCNVLEWNTGAENILGYKAEEIIGKPTKYYVPMDGYAEVDEIKERLLRGEHTVHMEVVRKHKDGRLIDCSATFTPVFDNNGHYIGSVAVFQDISEKKQIEYALKEAVRAAEEASSAKSSFLANMSHEIRTPMNGIIGFAELALDDGGFPNSVRDYLKKIKSSSAHLLNIINDILDISKIEAGAMEVERIPFSLHDIFNECEYISKPIAEDKGVGLYFYAEPYIYGRLIGDPTKLRQVLLNLLSNAIKFTNLGMVKLTSVLEDQKDNTAKISFEVRDSGIGMTSGQIQKVFAPFAQADSSTTRKYGGTGLGLSITKSFVEMMGGELQVDSNPGLGSKFSFTLVFDTTSEAAAEVSTKKELPSVRKKPVFKGEVLVCEDNSINQEVVVKHLSNIGLSSTLASNGQQALEEVKKRMNTGNPFDLILMDIHMPVMDGLEATKHLLETGCKTPIIALTANAMSTDKESYLAHGMSDYLSKPFTAEEIWSCLARHLEPADYEPPSETANDNILSGTVSVLNEKDGIEIAAGDEQLYRRVQRNFYSDNQDVIIRIDEAVRKGDIKLAHMTAHTLKGTAGLIGAGKLAQAANDVERALSYGETEDLSKYTKKLESALNEVFAILKPHLIKTEQITKSEIMVIDEAFVLIEKLSPLLESGNPESIELIDEIKTVLKPLGEVCDKLVQQLENFDFDIAFETICQIRETLKK